ncbi:four helix bundle protein [Flavobacterium sp.]|uniref:four helix bundle protein n=1 Tax=Flavobacterium sp. TaxID=239 RepID=UPI0037C0B694
MGSQSRRSADPVGINIVEGNGIKSYKACFIRFLVFSHSSRMETKNHSFKISMLYPTAFDNWDDLIL